VAHDLRAIKQADTAYTLSREFDCCYLMTLKCLLMLVAEMLLASGGEHACEQGGSADMA